MQLIPAIDIIGGKCVRLSMGDYARKTVYSDHPLDMALRFEEAGFERLHLVDLDGAKKGEVVNLAVLESIAAGSGLVADFGGGIKTDADMVRVFNAGASMAAIGSMAVKNPEIFNQWLAEYGPERIFLGADVREEKIAIHGWQQTTATDLYVFLEEKMKAGVQQAFCTDISKDGLLLGPATELYRKIISRFPSLRLTASGGIRSLADCRELSEAGCTGAIVGKALYEGSLSLADCRLFMEEEKLKAK